MTSFVHNVLYNHHLPGYSFLESTSQNFKLVSQNISRIGNVFNECIFLIKYAHNVPTIQQPVKILTFSEVTQLLIRQDGTSDRLTLKGKKFQWEYSWRYDEDFIGI